MRVTPRVIAGAVVLLAACAIAVDKPTELEHVHAPTTLATKGPDLVGLPDLIVDEKATQNNWLVRVEDLPANFCSVQEGGVTPGTRTVLRFTVTTPNVGDADVFIGSPLDHFNANDGLYELSNCHNHFHFQHYATYRLLDES